SKCEPSSRLEDVSLIVEIVFMLACTVAQYCLTSHRALVFWSALGAVLVSETIQTAFVMGRSLRRMHGAEHKVYNVCREPDIIGAARGASRLSLDCGSVGTPLQVMLVMVLCALATLFYVPVFVVFLVGGVATVRLDRHFGLTRHFPFRQIGLCYQRLVVAEPTELEIALAAGAFAAMLLKKELPAQR
ncbi:MAG: hypothetical protein PHT12_06385, partial [Patescibacteria group bacterium]|nr:hypothetical protein [Patescibacteria group bacterium]